MLNKKCKYYPCHEGLEDCTYCYCPIFPCEDETLGKWIKNGKKKIWDCSNCIIFHKRKFVKAFRRNCLMRKIEEEKKYGRKNRHRGEKEV